MVNTDFGFKQMSEQTWINKVENAGLRLRGQPVEDRNGTISSYYINKSGRIDAVKQDSHGQVFYFFRESAT